MVQCFCQGLHEFKLLSSIGIISDLSECIEIKFTKYQCKVETFPTYNFNDYLEHITDNPNAG